jgi:Ni,Fe-hydrogenase III large subunit/Ni,Fe-hydrogenase III component G
MTADFSEETTQELPSNLTAHCTKVGAVRWYRDAEMLRVAGARLLTLWGADDRDRDDRFRIYAAYLLKEGVAVFEHEMESVTKPTYPSLAEIFPCALRMERAVHDLFGIASMEPDHRGWLRHGGWPETAFPLRRDFDGSQQFSIDSQAYPFVQVEGDGVHEIAVGPVHAGTIEPGHFRFSVVGEKVLRLEERLGYTHKGVSKRFEEMPQTEGHRLAARLSGDSAVAFSWAYCAALEAITQTTCSPRAANLRALALEHERLANHLGDLGALGNDAGFAFGLTHFSRMKEDLLRINVAAFSARYLFDFIRPGGVATELPESAPRLLLDHYLVLEEGVSSLRTIYDNHAGLQDRFREAGTLNQELAEKLGAIGLAGRASGVPLDLRVDHAWPPYDKLKPNLITQSTGDVAARVQVRFDEIFESVRLCRMILEDHPSGPIQIDCPFAQPGRLGLGLIEAWRGPVAIALESGPSGTIRRCHAHDPSWQNWPLLEYAILGNIVPDFPLINKSFNLSYSGHDG